MCKWYALTLAIVFLNPLQLVASPSTAGGADADSVDEIVAKHVAARGGLESWQAVETMKITGTYTGFSIPAPFTLYRARPAKIWWDHMLGDKPVLIGGDQGAYWWIHGWFNPDKAEKLKPLDANVTSQDAEFATPFFDYKARGFSVDYAGEGALEGQRGLMLKLTRKTGKEETWYLDPETYLEFGRISKGSDFGTELDQTTFFSDFREVNGLQIPHLIETEFRTRHRVMEIESVDINPPVDKDIFVMPFPAKMKPFQGMLGDWQVATQFSDQPGAPFKDGQTTANVKPIAGGNLFIINMKVPGFLGDTNTFRTLSYNPAGDNYIFTYFNDQSAHTRIMTGKLQDGNLAMDNLTTDTAWLAFGETFYEKVEISDLSESGFTIKESISNDKGESWSNILILTLTRAKGD